MSKNFKPVIKTFAEISNNWTAIKSLDYRAKVKAYKVITFDIKNCYKKDSFTTDELDFFIKVLAKTKMDSPLQSKILLEWLKLTGYSAAKIKSKKNAKIHVETATIIVVDRQNTEKINASLQQDFSNKNMVSISNDGLIYFFGTCADGIYDIQIRIIDGPEPVLSEKEFKCVIGAGEPYYLSLPSGQLMAGDLGVVSFPEEAIVQTIEPGYYKLKVFQFYIYQKIHSYYIVLSKTPDPKPNCLNDIDSLESQG